MPIRWYKYHKIGFHYFLADLCYFVNLLLILSIWFFPQSKRLLISTYCLAFGNNAVAIVMWRNSMVFHSLDKVTSYVLLNPYHPLTSDRRPRMKGWQMEHVRRADSYIDYSSTLCHAQPCMY